MVRAQSPWSVPLINIDLVYPHIPDKITIIVTITGFPANAGYLLGMS